MKNSFLTKIVIVILLLSGVLNTFTIAADTSYTLLEPGVFKETTKVKDFNDYANLIFGVLLSASVALAILMIVIGGFEYVTSASGLGKSNGKSKIVDALTGLAIILLSYMVLYTINPCLVKWNFTVTELGSTDPAPASKCSTVLTDFEVE